MNTMMVTTGIGFAIPSNHMKSILDEVMKRNNSEPPKRYYIGIKTVTLEPHIVDRFKMDGVIPYTIDKTTKGCIVIAVALNSPAHK
jgi:S1-C subfamily serine protease